MPEDFAVFILTHGRPDRVKTYDTLRRQGYTGDIYVVIDNEDVAGDEYVKRFGDKVIVFDKLAVSRMFDDLGDFGDRRVVVYARNACFEIARGLGLSYFLELDDDYSSFVWKFTPDLRYWEKRVKNLDRLFAVMLGYYQSINALTIAFGQNGDLIGGKRARIMDAVRTKRKAMNTFFCSTGRPFQFLGRMNEDVNMYCSLGNCGALLLTVFNATIIQGPTQKSAGGMSDVYLTSGTYCKAFEPVMYKPSFVKVSEMGHTHRRLHHRITWPDAVPCILHERWRKAD